MPFPLSDIDRYRRFTIFILGCIIAFTTALEVYVHYLHGEQTGFTHLYYIGIVIVAILYHWRAVFFGAYLAALHIGIQYLISGGIVDTSALFRGLMFVLIAFLLGYIFERIEREHGLTIAYLIDRTLREPGSERVEEYGSGEISLRTIAGTTIPHLQRKRDVRGLVSALKHPDIETRYRAAKALGELADPAAIGPLSQALEDENSGVRWEAAESLGKIGDPAINVLINALHDHDDDIRWRAAIALGDIGNERAISPLIDALSDEDPYVRSRAVNSLVRIGLPAIRPLLLKIDDCGEVQRERIQAALRGIHAHNREAFEKILEESDPKLIEAARTVPGSKGSADEPEND
jgi:HEAT repeat protein